jgi:hypothetical protein
MTADLAKIIKSNPDVVDETLDADTLAVAGAHYIINKRLVVKDNTFQKHLGNGESEVIEGQELKVVIVRMAHSTSRIYYPNSFTQGTYTKPTCWSSDSKVPDREVLKPLSNSCNQCPYSVRNSVVSNGSSCRLSWRIAVVTADNLDGDVLQLIIPSHSCWQKETLGKWGLKPYIKMLADNKVNANRVVTKLHLDPLAQYPRMLFSPRAAVDSQYFEGLQKLGESEEAVNAVQLNVVPKLPDPEAFGFSKEDSMQPDRRAEANEIVQKWSHISKEI